jgi:hypothetical protein
MRPMPSPRGTNYANLFLPERSPVAAYDAAPGNGNLIAALQRFAVRELTPDLAAKLNILIEDNTDVRGAVAGDDPAPFVEGQSKSGAPRKFDPENVERAIDLLRSKNIDEETIDKIREISGVDKPTQAQDSARRERNRERNARDYYSRFPDTRRLGGDAEAAVDHATGAPSGAETSAYFKRFPEAKRLG